MKELSVFLMICLNWAPNSLAHLSCPCGWRNRGRIVGGNGTRENEYPWMASLSNNCGGSIITRYHVLTAAHCTDGYHPSSIIVSVGKHYQTGKNQHLNEHRVTSIFQHKGYTGYGLYIHDIAILVLATPITFNQYVGPVCLPKRRIDLEGTYIRAMGWGRTKGGGETASVLLQVDLKVISNSECKRSWTQLNKRRTQLCTYTPRKDTCNGDSGGALVHLDFSTNRYRQVALVSEGDNNCGYARIPSVNTDVYAYMKWIKNAIAKSHPEEKVCK